MKKLNNKDDDIESYNYKDIIIYNNKYYRVIGSDIYECEKTSCLENIEDFTTYGKKCDTDKLIRTDKNFYNNVISLLKK